MVEKTTWVEQDIFKLTVKQWEDALQDASIFDDNTIRMVRFVYNQNDFKSTASDIAKEFSTPDNKIHPNKIASYNRKAAKALYKKYNLKPPIDDKEQNRYWNVIFNGEIKKPYDENKHFFWKLRPNLVIAFGNISKKL